jgi:hypothetical protein
LLFRHRHPPGSRYDRYKPGARSIAIRSFIRALSEFSSASQAELRWWAFWLDAFATHPQPSFPDDHRLVSGLQNRFMGEFSYFFDDGWSEAIARSEEIATQLLAWIPKQPEMSERPELEQLAWAMRVHGRIMRYLTA